MLQLDRMIGVPAQGQPVARGRRCTHAPTRSCASIATRATAKLTDTEVSSLVSTVKSAVAKPGAVPTQALLDAVLALEKQKLPADGWEAILSDQRARWRLVWTAASKDVVAASKGQPHKGGLYFPLTAVQKFDAAKLDFENGVFLGTLAFLTFNGPYLANGRQLSFDVTNMNIGLGPLRFSIPLKKGALPLQEREPKERKELPFFVYAFVDEDIIVGRGRSGGLAVWQATPSPIWEAEAGVLEVYK